MKPSIFNETNAIIACYSADTCVQVPVHLHDTFELYQAHSDNIHYHIEGATYPLHKGDFVITNAGELHRPIIIDDQPYKRSYLQFSPLAFHQVFSEEDNPLHVFSERTAGQGNVIQSTNPHAKDMTLALSDLVALAKQKPAYYEGLLYAETIHLLILIAKAYKQKGKHYQTPVTIAERIQPMVTYINQHFTEAIDLDSLSHAFYIDKYYLSSLFKKNTGFTIMEYVQSKRIQEAKALILQDIPITSVSQQCGFMDYSNFYKTFKKLVRCSPSEYKKGGLTNSHYLHID